MKTSDKRLNVTVTLSTQQIEIVWMSQEDYQKLIDAFEKSRDEHELSTLRLFTDDEEVTFRAEDIVSIKKREVKPEVEANSAIASHEKRWADYVDKWHKMKGDK